MAQLIVRIDGVGEFQAALRKLMKKHPERLGRGLKEAGLYLQRESQKLTPVDTGDLRRSAFTRAKGKGRNVQVEVGFGQSYAIFVHEMVENNHPVGQAKFLETPLRERQPQMTQIIKNEFKKL